MPNAVLEELLKDAELVVNVGVRLGCIKDLKVLDALSNGKQALASDTATPNDVAEVQKALNSAILDIAPITLNDLRAGWTPFSVPAQTPVGTVIFGFFSILLIVAVAYITQIYDRAGALYASTIELRDARGADQATRLFGLLKRNREDAVDSLVSGNKDFLYEAFGKALFDLQVLDLKFQTHVQTSASVLRDLDILGRIIDLFSSRADISNPANHPIIESYIENYDKPESSQPKTPEPTTAAIDYDSLDIHSLLNVYIKDQRAFNSTINVTLDPLSPIDLSYVIVKLRDGMRILGLWVLPALFGMLGAVIFHMRRMLDPMVANPSWMRFAFRIVLGGFAGIILIWFWTPNSPKVSQPEFATLTSFGIAFLVGFSTDVFFQALDRFVNYLSQAIGKVGATT